MKLRFFLDFDIEYLCFNEIDQKIKIWLFLMLLNILKIPDECLSFINHKKKGFRSRKRSRKIFWKFFLLKLFFEFFSFIIFFFWKGENFKNFFFPSGKIQKIQNSHKNGTNPHLRKEKSIFLISKKENFFLGNYLKKLLRIFFRANLFFFLFRLKGFSEFHLN